VDLKTKIVKAFSDSFPVEYVRFDDEDPIIGYVVSPRFRRMKSLARQKLIDQALSPLTTQERRSVLMVAAVTPEEYGATGVPIRIHGVRPASQSIEIVLHGSPSDANYVRALLEKCPGVHTTKPKRVDEAVDFLQTFRVTGTPEHPVSRDEVIGTLKNDRYIELLPGN
jgi:hypothetical protein